MSSTTHPYLHVAPPPADLRFAHWPLGDEPITSGLVIAAMVVVGWYTGHVAQNWLIGLAAAAALALACWRIFVPTSYEITPKGVTPKVWNRGSLMTWRSFARYELTPSGVLLSPYAESTALAGIRGLFIPYGSRKLELIGAIQYYLGVSPSSSA